MINVYLVGRLGNQLFTYAMAEAIRQRRGGKEKIVFYTDQIDGMGWKVSLKDYNIPNVEFVSDRKKRPVGMVVQSVISSYFRKLFLRKKGIVESKRYVILQHLLNQLGIILEGPKVVDYVTPHTRNVLVKGYFQSTKYFEGEQQVVLDRLATRLPNLMQKDYVQRLIKENSVCISIKVEHNADNPLFDVCDQSYYEKALDYIKEHVENPTFFICSDNVQYVLDHYIDASKYNCIMQEKGLPVSDSLSIMGLCKHFVIGNTSFGWWAQYQSKNKDRIVVAPNRWLRTSTRQSKDGETMGWHFLDVTKYIEGTSNKYKNADWHI